MPPCAATSFRTRCKRISDSSPLDRAIAEARDALIAQQHEQGYWLYELEADCTIPAEYIMMMHFLDEIDAALEAKIANHLRARQADHGGWPLYHGGDIDFSCTIKAYYALKLAGDDIRAPHMQRARTAILAARRRRAGQCVHAHSAGVVRATAMARRALYSR